VEALRAGKRRGERVADVKKVERITFKGKRVRPVKIPKARPEVLRRLALIDGYNWQCAMARECGEDTIAGKEAAIRAGQYRALLQSGYGLAEVPVTQTVLGRRIVNSETWVKAADEPGPSGET
jgi:hypothetical protein